MQPPQPNLMLVCGIALGLAVGALGVALAALARTGASPVGGTGRSRRAALLVLLLGAVVAIAGTWLLHKPMYQATAVVRISPVIEPIVFQNEWRGLLPEYERFVNTEVSVIRSPTVLERVLDRPEVRATEWYRQHVQDPASVAVNLERPQQSLLSGTIERLKKSLDIVPRAGTELIDVSFTARKPGDAKTIADIVVSEYRKLREELDKMSDTRLAETLRTEQEQLQLEIDGLIKTRFNISSRLGTDAPEQLRSKLSEQLSDMEAELQKLQRELARAEWRRKSSGTPETNPASDEEKRLEIELLKRDVERHQKKVKEAGDIALEIANYDERIRQKRELYEKVRQRREVLQMEGKAPAHVRVAAYAPEPSEPCNDRRLRRTGIIAGATLLLGLLLWAWPRRI